MQSVGSQRIFSAQSPQRGVPLNPSLALSSFHLQSSRLSLLISFLYMEYGPNHLFLLISFPFPSFIYRQHLNFLSLILTDQEYVHVFGENSLWFRSNQDNPQVIHLGRIYEKIIYIYILSLAQQWS